MEMRKIMKKRERPKEAVSCRVKQLQTFRSLGLISGVGKPILSISQQEYLDKSEKSYWKGMHQEQRHKQHQAGTACPNLGKGGGQAECWTPSCLGTSRLLWSRVATCTVQSQSCALLCGLRFAVNPSVQPLLLRAYSCCLFHGVKHLKIGKPKVIWASLIL